MLLADAPRFLTLEGLQVEIAKYYYREGWSLEVFADPWEGPCLYVVADVPDAYHPGETVELRIRSNIPPIPSAEYFAIWLAWRIQLIESHEARELLRRRYDDRPVFDPHDFCEPGGRAARKEPA
jgi:hypothetical protein